jgi:hypothetical protein
VRGGLVLGERALCYRGICPTLEECGPLQRISGSNGCSIQHCRDQENKRGCFRQWYLQSRKKKNDGGKHTTWGREMKHRKRRTWTKDLRTALHTFSQTDQVEGVDGTEKAAYGELVSGVYFQQGRHRCILAGVLSGRPEEGAGVRSGPAGIISKDPGSYQRDYYASANHEDLQ